MIDYVSQEQIDILENKCQEIKKLQQQLLLMEGDVLDELKKIEIARYEGKTLIQHINSIDRVIHPKGEGNENITIEIKNGQIYGYFKVSDIVDLQMITSIYADDELYREHVIYKHLGRSHPQIPAKYNSHIEPLKKAIKRYKIDDFSRNMRMKYNLSLF